LLFETPSVAGLVEHIEIAQWVAGEPATEGNPAEYEEIAL
jgi:hypothetical protein